MKQKTGIFIIIFSFICSSSTVADEGLWLPFLLPPQFTSLQNTELTIPLRSLYSDTMPSVKDAVVQFGRACSGTVISSQGLLLTSYQCGFKYVQRHSTIGHNYIDKGFWAKSTTEELPNVGLRVKFLVRMEDVTLRVLAKVNDGMDDAARTEIIKEEIKRIEREAVNKPFHEAKVKSYFYGSRYYLQIMQVFPDVRLVGAPPRTIGQFGGFSDSWEWPYHAGNFALFRIYANENNEPASYSKDNRPYKPPRHFVITTKGITENQLLMHYGFPGVTMNNFSSFAIELIQDEQNPRNITIREKKVEIIATGMQQKRIAEINYWEKYAALQNYLKKWKLEIEFLKKFDVVAQRRQQEQEFTRWVNESISRQRRYGRLIEEFDSLYSDYRPWLKLNDYLHEGVFGIDVMRMAEKIQILLEIARINIAPDQRDMIIRKAALQLKSEAAPFYDSYEKETDMNLFYAMLKLYHDSVSEEFHPDFLRKIDRRRFRKAPLKYASRFYDESFFRSKNKFAWFLQTFSIESPGEVREDKLFHVFSAFHTIRRYKVEPQIERHAQKLTRLNRLYISGLREKDNRIAHYPAANYSLRFSFGRVRGYSPENAIRYRHFTTLTGVVEKSRLTSVDSSDYQKDERLEALYYSKDFGNYGKDIMFTNFISDIHTTGGSNGGPVFNGDGQLVGISAGRNAEGAISDFYYAPDYYRNVAVDVRYILFIVDKYAEATRLTDEMTIVFPDGGSEM